MKKYLLLLISFMVISCQKEIKSDPNSYLSESEQQQLKYNIVRYFEGLPKKADHVTKWDTINNSYYTNKAKEAELLHYYINEEGFVFFAIAKIAPSLKIKKVATIGKLKFEKDSLVHYEEICRTWKMELPELKEKTKILFDRIANESSVEKYYTKNSLPEYWIEFPDDNNFYNVKNRKWDFK